jgi:hypothetical protein
MVLEKPDSLQITEMGMVRSPQQTDLHLRCQRDNLKGGREKCFQANAANCKSVVAGVAMSGASSRFIPLQVIGLVEDE